MSESVAFHDLSPSPDREGRACAWIEEGGLILMTGLRWGGWTLPGGGIHPGETGAQAAVREAWEEAGARCEVIPGRPINLDGAECFSLRLLSLEPSPEGRPVAWVNPRSLPWADDVQIRQVLSLRGETPRHLLLPPLVTHALAQAALLGFEQSCSLETGRLLRSLAASRPGGQILELGSGVGAGAAWLLAGMDSRARLLTVDSDPQRAHATWELLRHDPRTQVLCGDWADTLSRGPFDLIFTDCAPAKKHLSNLDLLIDAMNIGALLVLDNFTPPAHLPAALHAGDPLRDNLLSHPRLSCVEVQVGHTERVILATRKA